MRKLAEEQRNERDKLICKWYTEGKSSEDIASKVGISSRAVRNVLVKYNIPRRRLGAKRKYSVNEDYFKTWSNEKA